LIYPLLLCLYILLIMKILRLSSLLFFLLPAIAFAQFRLLDANTHAPVVYASVTHKGQLLCTSDTAGNLSGISPTIGKVTIQHIAYKTFEANANSLSKVIYLTPTTYNLKDVEINVAQPEFICLRGYFRSYTVNREAADTVLKNYADGIVEYFIPINKGKAKHRLIEYRYFHDSRDSSFLQDLDIAKPVIPKVAPSCSNDFAVIGDSVVMAKGQKIGTAFIDSLSHTRLVKADMMKLMPRTKISLFGITVRMLEDDFTELSHTGHSRFPLLGFSSQNFISGLEVTLKKHDIFINVYDEFYVLEHRLVTKDEIKDLKLTGSSSIPKNHVISTEYWKTDGLPQLPSFVQNSIDTELKMY
jgi:hypothetical protein